MTVRAHLTGGNFKGLLTEHVAGTDVDDAEDGGEDASCDDEAPVVSAEGFFGRGGFVEVAEEGAAED